MNFTVEEIIKLVFVGVGLIMSFISFIVALKKKKENGEKVELTTDNITDIVMNGIKYAETLTDCVGAVKKVVATSYVTNELSKTNTKVESDKISNMIENFVDFSNVVNSNKEIKNSVDNKTWFNN